MAPAGFGSLAAAPGGAGFAREAGGNSVLAFSSQVNNLIFGMGVKGSPAPVSPAAAGCVSGERSCSPRGGIAPRERSRCARNGSGSRLHALPWGNAAFAPFNLRL